MAGLGTITADLIRLHRRWEALAGAALGAPAALGRPPAGTGRLREVADFGPNPGGLRLLCHVPERLAPRPALVVALHGCGQTAAGFDHGTGWSRLADERGFAVLLPEQQAANNPSTCFNWFRPADNRRDGGEAASIRQMVRWMVEAHGISQDRIFVTGLSAGGAMASVMLATYPDVFAAGAVIAGLPYGAADSPRDALRAMFEGIEHPARAWGDLVRAASPHAGRWPRVAVWHGTADTTVTPANAAEIVKQWRDLHALPERPTSEEALTGHLRRRWLAGDGEVVLEEVLVADLGHGVPLDTGPDAPLRGVAGPFLLAAGLSSTWHIARFFGLVGEAPAGRREKARPGLERMIVDALRRAGLA